VYGFIELPSVIGLSTLLTKYHAAKTREVISRESLTSEDLARNFYKAACGQDDCKLVEMEGDAFVEWLRKKIQLGTNFIYKNPVSLDRLGKPTPILTVLMAVE
jgi:hypothetical protein